jgi:hypothetical protein
MDGCGSSSSVAREPGPGVRAQCPDWSWSAQVLRPVGSDMLSPNWTETAARRAAGGHVTPRRNGTWGSLTRVLRGPSRAPTRVIGSLRPAWWGPRGWLYPGPDLALALHVRQFTPVPSPGGRIASGLVPLPAIPPWTVKRPMPGMATPTTEHRDQAPEELQELRRAQANMRLLLIAGIGLFTLFLVGLATFLYISTKWNDPQVTDASEAGAPSATQQADLSSSEL